MSTEFLNLRAKISSDIDNNVDKAVDWKTYKCKNAIKALIADGCSVSQVLFPLMLQLLGVETDVVNNGQEAINRVAAGENFNIIFMDRHIPVMKGLEATRGLRSIGFKNRIVGVGLANLSEMEDEKQEFMSAGTDDYVRKPVQLEEFGFIIADIDVVTEMTK